MNMLRLTWLACLLQAVVFPVYADDVLPGLWNITLSTTAAGMDSELGPYTRTQCFTQEDAQNPEKLFAELGGDCTYGDKNFQGSSFTFSVKCSGVVPMQGKGEVSFGATTFDGNIAIQANVPEMGLVQTKSRVTGSRLGDCQKSPNS